MTDHIQSEKIAYTTPALEEFGTMQELTAAQLGGGGDNLGGEWGSGVGVS